MNYYNYFTEVEEHFVRRRGKHMYVSPLDWALIATWRDSGIPLHVVLRGIDIAMDGFFAHPPRGRSIVSTLFFCFESVMEEYAQYVESHAGEEAPAPTTTPSGPGEQPAQDNRDEVDKNAVQQLLPARIREIKSLREKQSLWEKTAGFDRILSRLEEIAHSLEAETHPEWQSLERDLGILEELLISELRPLVPEEQMAAWEQEAKKELKVYKKRLPKETYQKILNNFMRGKIHKLFQVGELSLFNL